MIPAESLIIALLVLLYWAFQGGWIWKIGRKRK